jgi:hypothetical protein
MHCRANFFLRHVLGARLFYCHGIRGSDCRVARRQHSRRLDALDRRLPLTGSAPSTRCRLQRVHLENHSCGAAEKTLHAWRAPASHCDQVRQAHEQHNASPFPLRCQQGKVVGLQISMQCVRATLSLKTLFLSKHYRTGRIEADHMKRALAHIYSDDCNCVNRGGAGHSDAASLNKPARSL